MKRVGIIAGPCSAESEAQVLATARGVKAAGADAFRAGLWKPRSHPGSFEGVGAEGLGWLLRVRDELGMRVCTEVAGARHVEACLEAGLDMVWIGARTTANPFLVQEIADALKGSDVEVLVKNPVNPDMELWAGAIERLRSAGLSRLAAVHRGFSVTGKTRYRNDPEWKVAIEFRTRYPEIPLYCDPSHIAGDVKYIPEIAHRAVGLGFDGLMIETHVNPSEALSDTAQQLTPEALSELLSGGFDMKERDVEDEAYRLEIEGLRAQIDDIDESLLRLLGSRMEVSRLIGEAKKSRNVAILQTSRWESVLAAAVSRGAEYGLQEDFVREIFESIHEASIKAQE